MISGQTIIGDDLAYFRKKDGNFRAANIEKGIFGIIENVNSKDDPVIYEVLTKPGEVIFSNVLIGDDNNPYWMGMGKPLPDHGLTMPAIGNRVTRMQRAMHSALAQKRPLHNFAFGSCQSRPLSRCARRSTD